MEDYRYTELSYKITSLTSRTCCLGSSGLTYTQVDTGVMPFMQDSDRKNPFNTFQLSVPIAVNITRDNYVTCKMCPFIFAVLYTQVPTVAPTTDSRVVYMITHFITRCISQNCSVHSLQGSLVGMKLVCLRLLCVCRIGANIFV